jgi:putative transposase
MRILDREFTDHPFLGVIRMTWAAQQAGFAVGERRIRRLLREMGLMALYPKPRLSLPGTPAQRFPYLLRDLSFTAVNQVWSTDITYIPLQKGHIYLVAVIDWFSRYVLSWELSNTLHTRFCLDALERALGLGTPGIFNTDQGVQFTSTAFIQRLQKEKIQISWDGRGRCLDNIFVERLWRSVKYEEVYLKDYATVGEARRGLEEYFCFYNEKRPHFALEMQTPGQWFRRKGG